MSSGTATPLVASPTLDIVTCAYQTCFFGHTSLESRDQYDSAAWLYPSDGHLVEGWQDCNRATLISQARNQGLPALLTVGVDSHWSDQDLAQYIDQAAYQPQVPCTAQATTYICTIVNWATAGGYTGVIIDFESVKGQPDLPADECSESNTTFAL